MAYKMEANDPQFPKGTEFDCDGILVENGSSVTLTEEQERAFYARNQRSVKDVYDHSEIIKLSGSSALSSKEAGELKAAFSPEAVAEASIPVIEEPEEDEEVKS